MKTAVSIPNDVFKRAERFRRTVCMTRSRLYAAALEEYVARHDREKRIAAVNELIRKHGAPIDDGWLRMAADTIVRNSEW